MGRTRGYNKFHFVGYFSGNKINRVFVKGGEFIKDEDYVLLLTDVENSNQDLYSKHVRSKKIF